MSGLEPVNFLFRFIHIFTAITIFGGTLFMYFVLMPAAEKISQEAHQTLREFLLKKWKIFIHTGIVLFLVSGFYNYLVVMRPKHSGDSLYHMLIGIKILFAFIIFFLASVLVGRAAVFEKLRQKRKMWLLVIIALATLIVLISSFLKIRGVPSKPETDTETHGERLMNGRLADCTIHFSSPKPLDRNTERS